MKKVKRNSENYQKELLDIVINILKKDERLTSEGELLKNKINELAIKQDGELLNLLASHNKTKEIFFTKINDKLVVFNKDKFLDFINNKEFLPDSYTAFKNKIGLIDSNSKFVTKKENIVLAWPYKDAVLEGGQTKEDANRNEMFWNETLAHDQVDRLLSPKVFTKGIRISDSDEEVLKEIERDDEGKILENLIIKGNNLLAIHSLVEQFAAKIKLIYLDPPYNTPGAANTFSYNNSFNHSSWLTFMKNRLEASKKLMTDDGFVAISIDHVELFYLGALADEVFGRDNRVGILAIETNPRGRSDSKFFATSHEYLLVYVKDTTQAKLGYLPLTEEQAKAYK